MNVTAHSIAITHRLELTNRELELLNNFLSYGSLLDYLKGITPNSYNGGVTREEMTSFINSLKAAVLSSAASVNRIAKEHKLVRV